MMEITVSEKDNNSFNVDYIVGNLTELFLGAHCSHVTQKFGSRVILKISCPDNYGEVVKLEVLDRISEIIAIKYKYDFFKDKIKVIGLNEGEKEILYSCLIAADLEEDKKYIFDRLTENSDFVIDAIFNFRLSALKKKWEDIVSYIPSCFGPSKLKDFVFYLLENKKYRVYVEGEKVYDRYFKRLNRCDLLEQGELKITREVLLSNCGEVEISGNIPKEDREYISELFEGRIIFSDGYFL